MNRCVFADRILAACAALASVCAAPVFAGPAQAGGDDRFLMLDRSLRATPVSVVSIGPNEVRVVVEAGEEPRAAPLAEIVALAPDSWRPGADGNELTWLPPAPAPNRREPAPAGMLLLTDGRRIVGRFAEGQGDGISWAHPRLGRWTFPLDDIRRVRILPGHQNRAQGPAPAPQRDAGDRVIMTNGDVVTGFVDSIDEAVKVEDDGREVELPLRQVAAIELSNPATAPSGLRVWLSDGSVIGADGFGDSTATGVLRLDVGESAASAASGVALPIGDVVAIAVDASRVVPLASLTIASQQGVGERRYAEPASLSWRGKSLAADWRETASAWEPAPPLDAPDIELPGPMTVEWVLPANAARVAGWAEVPPESRLWAEFTMNIEGVTGAGSRPKVALLASEAMSGARPVVEFNIELPRPAPERLRISIDPGSRGPIQDRVLLRRALVLIGR